MNEHNVVTSQKKYIQVRLLEKTIPYMAKKKRKNVASEIRPERTMAFSTLTRMLGRSPAEVTRLLWDTYNPGQVWTPCAVAGLLAAGQGFAQLSVNPITWDVVGLDSNRPLTSGPELGMAGKVREMLNLVQTYPGLQVHILSGQEPGLLTRALLDPNLQSGTRITSPYPQSPIPNT